MNWCPTSSPLNPLVTKDLNPLLSDSLSLGLVNEDVGGQDLHDLESSGAHILCIYLLEIEKTLGGDGCLWRSGCSGRSVKNTNVLFGTTYRTIYGTPIQINVSVVKMYSYII